MAAHSGNKTAVIVGAGPAGLTAAFELLKNSDIKPIVLEQADYLGGIARTINYKGNRMDIGGHRFFSKSDRVMDWWLDIMPLQNLEKADETVISYRRQDRTVDSSKSGPDPDSADRVMLVRARKSRIYFMRKFFDYPISLSLNTLTNLGLVRTIKVGFSYLKASAFQIKPEQTLDQFFINRFGRELYLTFFKSYTEKVWGVPCGKISAAWGAQRVKGLSLWKALAHLVTKTIFPADIKQKSTETSLIERFLYPKLGPGQMWEYVASQIQEKGGEIRMNKLVTKVNWHDNHIDSLTITDSVSGESETISGDYFFSTMPMKDLVRAMEPGIPEPVKQISEGLVYRDFITVGLLVNRMKISENPEPGSKQHKLITDNWIYIQEPDVKLGRLQIFNNWSPYLVADSSKVWLGLEYFCDETDDIWSWDEKRMARFAAEELEKIGIIEAKEVIDSTSVRVPKTYPGYFGTYDRFDELRAYTDKFENLFLVGRNGMHKYNNQDHSMLTAMTAVENILNGVTTKDNLWSINMEEEYHEEKSATEAATKSVAAS